MTGRTVEARDGLLEHEKVIAKRGDSICAEHDLTLGYIASMVGDWPRVDACARRLMGRSPQLADGYVLKGMVTERLGDLDGAIRYFRKAAELAPGRAMPRTLLARAEAAHVALGCVALADSAR